jgi:hypothetical protein
MLQSNRLVADAARSFADNRVNGIEANEARIPRTDGATADAGDGTGAAHRLRQGGRDCHDGAPKRDNAPGRVVRLGHLGTGEFESPMRPERMARPG